ncbi:MAG: flippase [Halobacteriota archaeon]|nr:flippase [Halobacteriota archaeon]
MNSAAKGSAVMVVAFFVTAVLNYVFNVGAGWLLSPEDFGVLGVSLSFLMILQLFTSSGFPQTTMKFLAEDRSDKTRILKTSLFGNLFLGVISGLIFYMLFRSGFIELGEKYDPIILIITLTVIITSVAFVIQFTLQGLFKFNESAYVAIVGTVTKLVFGIGLIIVGFGVFGAMVGMLISSVCILVISLFYTSDLKFWKEPGWSDFSIFKFAAPMFIGTFSLALLMQIDILGVKFLVTEASSDEMAGYYQSALVLARTPTWIMGAVMGAIFPFISNNSTKNREDAKVYINKSVRYAFIFVIPISLVFFLIPEASIYLLFPENYLPAAPALAIISIGMALYVLITIFLNSFQALGEPNIPSFFLSLSVIIQILLLILLVPIFGIVGAALSTTIACLVGLVSLTLVYVGIYRPGMNKNDVFKVLLSFTLMGMTLLIFPHSTRIYTLLDVVVSGGVYLAIIMIFGLITKEDLDILFGALPKNRYFEALPEILTNFQRYDPKDPFKNIKNWNNPFKSLNLRYIDEYMPYALMIFCIASLRFIEQESLVLMVFIVTLLIYIWRRYDSRILIGFAIVLLMFTAIVLVNGSESYAENIAILAYYSLVIGVIAQLVDYLRESRGIRETS